MKSSSEPGIKISQKAIYSEIAGKNKGFKAPVLMVSDDFLPAATGVGVHLQILCKELVLAGHQVVVLTSKQGQQESFESWEGVTVHRFKSIKIAGFYQALPSLSQIRSIAIANKIQVVHFHYLSFMLLMVVMALGSLSLKSVYTFHMTEDHLTQPLFLRPFRKIIRNIIVRFCNSVDAIISPSVKLKEQISALGISKPIHFISNPVSRELFGQEKISTEQTFASRTSQKAAFQILYVGRLNPEKNIPLLLQAFAEHLKNHPLSRLWIIGKGDQERALQRMAHQLNIASQVEFLGFMKHSELAEFYLACHLFVLPSTVETQGMVAMEAMSFSKPVIVTSSIVSANELVTPNSNGFIVDAYDPKELVEKLNLLASSPELCERLGRAGLLRIKNYDPRRVLQELLTVYGSLFFDKDAQF